MIIEGLDWMEWLHAMREREYEKAREQGLSALEYLKEAQSQGRAAAEKHGIPIMDERKISTGTQ